jgi:hypothetical protein
MPRFMTVVTAIMVALTVTAVASATAMAVAPEFNPAKGTFTSKSGKAKLQVKGGAAIECTGTTGKGEITGAKKATSEIKFTACKAAGLGVLSISPKGAANEIVTPTLNQELCYISKAGKTVGVISTLSTELKLEVPSTKKVINIKGAAIGEATPVNSKLTTGTLALTQVSGVQGIEKCEGGAAQTLLTQEGAGAFTQSGQEIKGEITFAAATEVTA